MKNSLGTIVIAVISAGLVVLTGCESKSDRADTAQTAPASTAALPSGLLLQSKPENAVDVMAVKKSAQPGDSVVVTGRIGGRQDPFVKDRAIFQLVDASLPTCAENPGDSCETPWDYCCEPAADIAAKSATIQVVSDDGKPLAIDLEGQGRLAPMARVVVSGKVAQKPNETTMIINADGIYVQQ